MIEIVSNIVMLAVAGYLFSKADESNERRKSGKSYSKETPVRNKSPHYEDEHESKFGDGPVSIRDLDSVDDLDELTDEQYDDVAEQLEEWADEQETALAAAVIIAKSQR